MSTAQPQPFGHYCEQFLAVCGVRSIGNSGSCSLLLESFCTFPFLSLLCSFDYTSVLQVHPHETSINAVVLDVLLGQAMAPGGPVLQVIEDGHWWYVHWEEAVMGEDCGCPIRSHPCLPNGTSVRVAGAVFGGHSIFDGRAIIFSVEEKCCLQDRAALLSTGAATVKLRR